MKDDLPILLVEDDMIDVQTVKRAFKANEMQNKIYNAENGEDALEFLRKEGKYAESDDTPRPGLILLDINMPVMNGLEFLKIVKSDADLKKIPVIMLTTSKDQLDRETSFLHSVAGYIVKPIDFDDFVNAIKVVQSYWLLSEQS